MVSTSCRNGRVSSTEAVEQKARGIGARELPWEPALHRIIVTLQQGTGVLRVSLFLMRDGDYFCFSCVVVEEMEILFISCLTSTQPSALLLYFTVTLQVPTSLCVLEQLSLL